MLAYKPIFVPASRRNSRDQKMKSCTNDCLNGHQFGLGLAPKDFRLSMRSAFALLALNLAISQSYGQNAPTLADIRAAWKANETNSPNAHIVWSEKATYVRGAISDLKNSPEIRRREKDDKLVDGDLPPNDVHFDLTGEMKLSGERIWRQINEPEWSNLDHQFKVITSIATWDGKVGRTFSPNGTGNHAQPQGSIRLNFADSNLLESLCLPIWLTLRGETHADKAIDWDAFDPPLTTRDGKGNAAVLLTKQERRNGRSRPLLQLWTEPKAPYRVIRVVSYDGENMHYNMDIDYSPSEVHPKKWRQTKYSPALPKNIMMIREVTVEKWEQLREPFAESNFAIRFPKGSTVYDDTEGHLAKIYYHLSPDDRREIDRKMGPLDYQKVVEHFERTVASERQKQMWWILGSGIALFIAVLLMRSRFARKRN